MTKRRPGPDNAIALRPRLPTAHEVGYGKPPEHTKFRKGQSGNPRGRPKGARNRLPALNEERMKQIILEEAYRTITVREGEKQVSLPMAKAIIRALAVSAAKGQPRAQRLFAELLSATESANKQLHDEWLNTVFDYKANWEGELARRERLGITGLPEPLPHPDHLVVDMQTGNVRVIGPMTKEEKKAWDYFVARRTETQKELEELEQELRDEPNHPHRKLMEDDIEHDRKILALIDGKLGR
jgi:hypothetical protein